MIQTVRAHGKCRDGWQDRAVKHKRPLNGFRADWGLFLDGSGRSTGAGTELLINSERVSEVGAPLQAYPSVCASQIVAAELLDLC